MGNALILYYILSTFLKRNVLRSVWRICMWIFDSLVLHCASLTAHNKIAAVKKSM